MGGGAAALLCATYVGGSANFFGVAAATDAASRFPALVPSLLALSGGATNPPDAPDDGAPLGEAGAAFYLVDLAGSERLNKTNSRGDVAREAKFINKFIIRFFIM